MRMSILKLVVDGKYSIDKVLRYANSLRGEYNIPRISRTNGGIFVYVANSVVEDVRSKICTEGGVYGIKWVEKMNIAI